MRRNKHQGGISWCGEGVSYVGRSGSNPNRASLVLAVLASALAGCAKGSTGEFDETGGGASTAPAGTGGVGTGGATGGSTATGGQSTGGTAPGGASAGGQGAGGDPSCGGGSSCAVANVQLDVVSSLAPERTVIRNTSTTCTVNLCNVGILHNDGAGEPSTLLPSQLLSPGDSVVVSEAPGAGELSSGGAIDYTAGTGGAVYLCDGACSLGTGSNVVDAFLFDTPPATPPAPVQFSPAPLSLIAAADEADMEYVRTAHNGAHPTFLAADWDTRFVLPTLFYDSFEDQDFSDWTAGGGYAATIESVAGSHGDYCFALDGSSSHWAGFVRQVPSMQPTEIEIRVRTNNVDTANGYVVIGSTGIDTGCTNCFAMLRFGSGQLRHSMVTAGPLVTATNNTFYRVEFRNINWTSKTTDIYVDGTIRASNIGFRDASTNDVREIHFYNFTYAKAWWDELRLIQ